MEKQNPTIVNYHRFFCYRLAVVNYRWKVFDHFHLFLRNNGCQNCCCVSVWVICPTSDRKVKVEHLISKRTHKPIALRFWVRVWRLSCLCGCSSLDVAGPPSSPSDPTVVSEPRFDEGYDRGSRSVCAESSNGGTSVSARLRRNQQWRYMQVKAFAWGGAWWIDGLTLEGECCCVQVWVICPTSDRKVKVEHLISKRIHKPIALRFWVRVWCLSCLCGCSSLDVAGPPDSPSDPSVVSKPRFDEGCDRGSRSLRRKQQRRYKQLLIICWVNTDRRSVFLYSDFHAYPPFSSFSCITNACFELCTFGQWY